MLENINLNWPIAIVGADGRPSADGDSTPNCLFYRCPICQQKVEDMPI